MDIANDNIDNEKFEGLMMVEYNLPLGKTFFAFNVKN